MTGFVVVAGGKGGDQTHDHRGHHHRNGGLKRVPSRRRSRLRATRWSGLAPGGAESVGTVRGSAATSASPTSPVVRRS
jgi:hypothetical protein